jgi:NADH dehydrogenase
VRDPVRAAARLADTTAELFTGDVRDPDSLNTALSGSAAVVHLAAIAIERGKDTYESVNTEATARIIDAARTAEARRIIFTSQNGASWSAPSRFLRSKGKAEELVKDSGLDWTVLRPSVIFGPEDEFVNVLARVVRLSPVILPLPDGGQARFQPIAVADVAGVIASSLERRDTVRKVYALGGPTPLSLREIAERILLAMRAKRTIVAIPRSALRPLLAILQWVLPRPPVTTGLLDLLGQDNVIADNALTRVFHIEPTPFAPEELHYLRRITVRDALGSLFR